MKIKDIEKLVLNKYQGYNFKSQQEYLIESIKRCVSKNIKISLKEEEVNYLLELNKFKFDNFILKLIEDNKIDRKKLLKNLEVK